METKSNDLISYTDPDDIDYQDIITEESFDIYEGLEAYQAAQRQKANEPFQQILSWINRTRAEIENATESDIPGYLSTCLDDIEKLCKEQVK